MSARPAVTPLPDVDAIFDVLAAGRREGGDGEALDQLAHALQCAHVLAERHPDDVELQVAGLLHDIGHHLVPGDDAGHGMAAADAVAHLLGDRVALLIEHHVPAKRYLVTTDPTYRDELSTVSVRTLANQGGTMTDDEVAAHAALAHWEAGLELRRADEAAKVPGRSVPGLDRWRPIVESLAARHAGR